MTTAPETRHIRRFGLRPEVKTRDGNGDGELSTISGYGAVFFDANDLEGTEFRLWRNLYERIMPGAFDETIREHEVVSSCNHDLNLAFASTAAGTLRLSVDNKGLRYEADPLDTQTIRDQVVMPIRNKIINGSSFMFDIVEARWVDEVRDEVFTEIFEITKVRLYEVGPVVLPAYTGTTSEVDERCVRDIRSSYDAMKAKRNQAVKDRVEADDQWRRHLDLTID